MGSSFADGAWDRESAVYRISGVLTVISGWFLTAFSAFTACLIVALIVFNFGEVAAIILMLVASACLIRSNFLKKDKDENSVAILKRGELTSAEIRDSIREAVSQNMNKTMDVFRDGVTNFLEGREHTLKESKNEAVALFDEISRDRGLYYRMALHRVGNPLDDDARHFYYRAFTNMKEAAHNLRSVLGMMENHLANQHRLYTGELKDNLLKMLDIITEMNKKLAEFPKESGGTAITELPKAANEEVQKINQYQLELLRLINQEHLSLRSTELYLSLLQCTREIINRYTIVMVLQGELSDMCEPARA